MGKLPKGHRPASKKGKGKTPRTHQVMGLNPWEVVTPKMGILAATSD